MKKNIYLRIAAVLLAGCLFGLCTVPGTLSKFSQNLSGGGGGKVRAGVFAVAVSKDGTNWMPIGGGELGDPINIDLFQTLYQGFKDTGPILTDGSFNDAANTSDVGLQTLYPDSPTGALLKESDPNKLAIIAPGTGGHMKISVKNFSEVAVELNVEVLGGGSNTHGVAIEWWHAGAWNAAFPPLTGGGATLPPVSVDTQSDVEFVWRWQFERGAPLSGADSWKNEGDINPIGGFAGDTPLGVLAAASGNTPVSYSIPLKITATQID